MRELVGALNAERAAQYLGYENGRSMDEAPIPWVDLRKPGGKRPVKRWRVVDLDAFLESRLVQPGFPSPFGGLTEVSRHDIVRHDSARGRPLAERPSLVDAGAR